MIAAIAWADGPGYLLAYVCMGATLVLTMVVWSAIGPRPGHPPRKHDAAGE